MSDTKTITTPEKWLGIFKVLEEMGELQQVLGKLGPFPSGEHPDGAGNLRERLQEEIADVCGALDYFSEVNELDANFIMQRAREKKARFKKWILTGVKSDAA